MDGLRSMEERRQHRRRSRRAESVDAIIGDRTNGSEDLEGVIAIVTDGFDGHADEAGHQQQRRRAQRQIAGVVDWQCSYTGVEKVPDGVG